jgi:translation elongation factor EF-1beta
MTHRKVSAIHDINSVIGEALLIQPQSSHIKMLTSVMKPLARNFEILLTPVRVNSDELTAKIKQSIPPGFQVKKDGMEPENMTEDAYSVMTMTRLTGQTISIYPSDIDVALKSIVQNPIIVISQKLEMSGERRKGKRPLRFQVMLPQGWVCTTYENSGAQDFKSLGANYTHSAFKIYSEYQETGKLNRDALNEARLGFLSEFYGDCGQSIDIRDFMPPHRMIVALFDAMTKIDELTNSKEADNAAE